MTNRKKCCCIILSALLSGSLGCQIRTASEPAKPIIVLGTDGLEWDVVLPLIEADQMPNLAALMERGTYGHLRSLRPTSSPIIWTTVATGKVREKHGILDFSHRTAAGERALYNSRDRTTKALWNIVGDYNKRVAAIGWWMTYPVEPVRGVMVAQTNTLTQLNTRG